jgi:hypothetical protein
MDMPVIDHRSAEFGKLGRTVLEGSQKIFQTKDPVVIFPSSEPDRKKVSGFNRPVIPSDLQRFEGAHHAVDQNRSYPVSTQWAALHK